MNRFSKRTRLKNFDYVGRFRYFITICTHQKLLLFKQKETVENCIKFIDETSKSMGFRVWAYCFMPDHLHLLLEGEKPESDLKRFITAFKQRSGYNYRNNLKITELSDSSPQNVAQSFSSAENGKLWQPSYYDHVLRKDEDLKSVIQYIFNNPVRKGIVEQYADYPFLGSLEKNLNRM